MMFRNLTIILAIIYCLFAADSIPLCAQPTQDYRLSSDPYEYRLPEDIRIQAVAELDEHTLVVWGTMVESGDEVVSALVMNIDGNQGILTNENARPTGVVSIVPVNDRFLVLWNDRREGKSGIYSAVVHSDGQTIGDEVLIRSEGTMAAKPQWWIGENRVHLVWNDVQAGDTSTYTAEFAQHGNMTVRARQLSKLAMDSRQTFILSQGGFLIRYLDGSATLVQPDGEFDPRSVPSGRLDLPHYFINDSTIAIVEEEHFRVYASLFDSIAARSVALPYGGHLATGLSRDSSGWFLVAHEAWRRSPGPQIVEIRRLFDPDNVNDTSTVFTSIAVITVLTNQLYVGNPTLENYSVVMPAQNVLTFEMTGHVQSKDYGQTEQQTVIRDVTYDIRGFDAFPPTPSVTDPIVLRRDSFLHSGVAVISENGTDTATFSITFPRYPYRPLFMNPSIAVRNGVVVLGWYGTDDSLRSVAIKDQFSVSPHSARAVLGKDLEIWPWGMATTVQSNPFKFWERRHYSWLNNSYEAIWTLQDTGWRYDRAKLLHQYASGNSDSGPEPTLVSVGVDIGNTRAFSLTYFPSVQNRSARQIYRVYSVRFDDATSAMEWETTVSVARPGIIPLDSTSVLLFTAPDSACIVGPNGVSSCMFIKPKPQGVRERFHRLPGARFLRAFADDHTLGVSLEIYDFNGTVEAETTLPDKNLDEKANILLRKSDRSIVVIGGGSSGVRLTYLDRNLREVSLNSGEILADKRVSATSDSVANPTGLFKGDTLFVAWEDFRSNEGSDIYGTQWVVPSGLQFAEEEVVQTTDTTETPGGQEPLESDFRMVQIHPNPTVGAVTLNVESVESLQVNVAVYNILGQRIMHRSLMLSPGITESTLNVSGLRSGLYEIVIDSGTYRESREVIVYGR